MKMNVKICGITSREDALRAASAGATHLGFIIDVPTSKRNKDRVDVGDIVKSVKNEYPEIICVGVFVDKSFDDVVNVVKECELDAVQLHGDESVEFCWKLRNFVKVYKAIIVTSENDLDLVKKYKNVVDRILLDAGKGSGEQIDLDLLKGTDVDILAGGINPRNVKEITNTTEPQMIDISSGVEFAPGKKGVNLVAELFSKLNS
jgi:phosphoribosylanthranilate isomerase